MKKEGKTQGETNEKRPATKAAIKETSFTLNIVIINNLIN